MSASTVDELRWSLRRSPELPAFVDERGATVLRRGELADLEQRTAAVLHAWDGGLGPGDTIALAVRPGPAALAVVLAAVRLRIRVALVDPMAGPEVVTARLALAKPRLVVADAYAQAAAGWAAPLARRAGLHLPRLAGIAPVATLGRRLPGSAPSLQERRPQRGATAGAVPDHASDAAADALVIFTSGTTGQPRAVVHTTHSLGVGMGTVADLVHVESGATVVGSTFFVMAPALLGGARISLPERRPRRLAAQLARLRPGTTYLTPPAARGLLTVVERTGQRLDGRFYSGSAPVSSALLSRLRDAGAEQAWGVYAMTEAFPIAAVEATDKLAWEHEGPSGGDLVGALLGGIQARVDDAGQLHLRGSSVCDRYLGEPGHAEVATGDRARLERDGQRTRVVLEGRMKDMVLRGAENVYPGLYEPMLHVPGVELALLVGVPRDDLDEELVLLVQPSPGVGERQVRARLRAPLARLGNAAPDRVVMVAAIPTSGRSRKPDREAAARLVAQLDGARRTRAAGAR